MSSLILGTAEAKSGREAFRQGHKREDCPYQWVGNNRNGDRKRACWEAGWDHEQVVSQTTNRQAKASP